jgi:prolyl oligopeptidase
VATGKQLPDEINWCKFSNVAWTKDGKGFFYARYQAPSTGGKDDGAGTEVEAAAGQKVS